MAGSSSLFGSREQGILHELITVLGSSLELQEVLSQGYPLLERLVPTDYAAVCVSNPEQPTLYDWIVSQIPMNFFAAYPDLARDDFVRASVILHPNRVLRDSEMRIPEDRSKNGWFQRCRELGLPLQHAMAVLMAPEPGWHGGITLYRERRRPFSDRERQRLQHLVPFMTNTMRNCRLLNLEIRRSALLDQLLHHQHGNEVIVFVPPAIEIDRTRGANELLERWFSRSERGPQGLPDVLVEYVAQATHSHGLVEGRPDEWVRSDKGKDLRASVIPLSSQGKWFYVLVLREKLHLQPLPEAWRRRLTAQQHEVAMRAATGWDNRLIADDLGCKVGTVKKHLLHIYDRLGIPGRGGLRPR